MNNKICVYAICLNEKDNIDRWLESMSEADYIVVLDTGSTDGTYEKLSADPKITLIKQEKIVPWRFDSARNASLKLVPNDANILVCTDLDEFFEPGWADILRNNWTDECTKCLYTYAWSHNSYGEPMDVFMYDKIHKKDYYHWKYPVHEILVKNDENQSEHFLYAGETIYLHHVQDKSKSRSSYMHLLDISVEENPNDAHVIMLRAREHLLKNQNDLARKDYLRVLQLQNVETNILLETYGRLADISFSDGKDGDGMMYCLEFMKLDNTYREPYFILAGYLIGIQQYVLAKNILETAFAISTRKYTWVERGPYWLDLGYKMLGECFYQIGDYSSAIDNYEKAAEYGPLDKATVFEIIKMAKQGKDNN